MENSKAFEAIQAARRMRAALEGPEGQLPLRTMQEGPPTGPQFDRDKPYPRAPRPETPADPWPPDRSRYVGAARLGELIDAGPGSVVEAPCCAPATPTPPDARFHPLRAKLEEPPGGGKTQVTIAWNDGDWLRAHRKANAQLAEQIGRLTNLLQDAWRERDQALANAQKWYEEASRMEKCLEERAEANATRQS